MGGVGAPLTVQMTQADIDANLAFYREEERRWRAQRNAALRLIAELAMLAGLAYLLVTR